MIWAVLDTNVLVSGLGWDGSPGRVVDRALQGRFVMVSSRAILDELARTLQYPKLAPHFPDPIGTVVMIRAASVVVEPSASLEVVEADPDDNKFLEAAQAGDADYIVTGDSHLLDLRFFEGTEIIRPRRFFDLS